MKTVLPNVRLRCASARQANFVIEGYVDPSSLRYDATSPLGESEHREGPFGDHTGYYTLPEPYPVFHPATAGPSRTARTPSIPRRSSAFRRWRIFTSAASRDCGMKLFLPIPPRRDELPRDRGPRVAGGGRLPQPRLEWGSTRVSRVGFGVSPKPSGGPNEVSGATPDTAGGTPALSYKIMHGLWGLWQMIPRLRDQIHRRGGR